jgi:GDP-mannose 6-dehydrogenase
MNICIVGLGYVGAVSAACLARRGHKVWGVDISQAKVNAINAGHAPAVEPGLEDAVRDAVCAGSLTASSSIEDALRESDLCLVAVATPSTRAGRIDSTHLLRACRQIAEVLRNLGRTQVVAIRSSVLPHVIGEVEALFDAEAPGLAHLCVNPEFLREGSAIHDFENPPYTVIGTASADAERLLRAVYEGISAPVYALPTKEAAMVKYASNAFHAAKVAFANEVGALCRGFGVDGSTVMDVFCSDTKLNISRRYLKPGFAFGGSCLPKDVRALLHAGNSGDVELPLLRGVLESNESVLRRAVQQVVDHGGRRIGLIGLSFKSRTDDLRESPFVELAERLLGKGFDVKIYDPNVSVARLVGANREYIERSIPHLSALLVSGLEEVGSGRDLVLVGHYFPGVEQFIQQNPGFAVLDLSTSSSVTSPAVCESIEAA